MSEQHLQPEVNEVRCCALSIMMSTCRWQYYAS